MTALKAHEVARFLARPDLSEGVVLAYGPDAGLVREAGQRLISAFCEANPGAERVTLDANELDADPSRLAMEARTISLFGERRVIRVRGASKSLTTTLSDLLEDPGGILIVLEAGNLTPKDALRALVETAPKGRALPCYPDSDETRDTLIRETFSKAGIALDPDVVVTLRDLLGNDREVTRRELEKLELFARASKHLTYEDIIILCADNAALVIDEVVDNAASGHAAHLEDAISRALAAAVDPQRLLAVSSLHFAQLRRWRAEMDTSNRPARDVLDNARPRPHFSRKASLERQLRLWSDNALATATDRLYTAIADSRRRYGMAEIVLRRTLLAICLMAAER